MENLELRRQNQSHRDHACEHEIDEGGGAGSPALLEDLERQVRELKALQERALQEQERLQEQ